MSTADPVEPTVTARDDATPDLRPSRAVAASDWLVRRASSFLAARSSRRGFLVGAAVTGSAVAAAGVKFATQPGSAYAAITDCPPGSMCRDGYTEFCCVINAGQNTCPPGSFAGGWWRADFSTFCNGTRYYIDCMQFCCGPLRGDGFCSGCVQCQCGGGCDNRRIYCNYFRYGQCHQEIAQSGPIACRVVTCVAPYLDDPSCSPVSAVDNATAEHTAACLTSPPPPPPPPPAVFRSPEETMAVAYTFTNKLWELFYINADGAVIHSWYPASNGVGSERVGGGAKPAGQLQVVRQETSDGFAGRADVYAEAGDGRGFLHWFQNAPTNYAWVADGGRW